MKLISFLEKTDRFKSANDFATQIGLPVPVLSRFLNGTRNISAQTMAKIVAATNGEVTYEDLIAEMQERQAARKQNGNGDKKAA